MTSYAKICEWCERPFVASVRKRRFCSHRCSTTWVMQQPEHRELMRQKVWNNPKWSEQRRRALAEVKKQPGYQKFMDEFLHRTDHPFKDPKIQERAHLSNQENGWQGLCRNKSGNGAPPTLQEQTLSTSLGWTCRLRVTVGDGQRPYHYEIDVANEECLIGIEIDGQSHNLLSTRRADARKTQRLERIGWKIIRFTNSEVNKDLAACLKTVRELRISGHEGVHL